MHSKKSFPLVALCALVLAIAAVFAGCAQDNTDTTDNNPEQSEQTDSADKGATQSAAPSGAAIALAADPSGALKYDKTELSGDAGTIEIKFTNDSSTPHDVTVEGDGGEQLGATDQITESDATLELKDMKAGSYTFFCSVPGHEEAGMKGTLTVK